MKLIATIPVRNEAWVLGLSARVALMWCDELCILNHASTDRTAEIIGDLQGEYPGRVHVVSMPGEVWTEMQHRECLLEMARQKGATHIAIVDADEILTGNLLGVVQEDTPSVVRMTAASTQPGCILQFPLYNMRGSIDTFHVNGIWGKRWGSVAFKDNPRLYWARAGSPNEEYDHHQREPKGMLLNGYRPVSQGNGGIMHLWGVTEKRLVAKHALYKLTEAIKWPEKSRRDIDQMYSLAIHGRPPHDMPAGWQYQKAPPSWWLPYGPLMQYLDLNAEPWQIEECWRLVKKHGRAAFAGLDLFGVV